MPSIRARRPSRVRNAVAAGGVVVRQRDGKREVVLAGRHADGTWVFPKGTPDKGEEIEDTALREVEEETGLRCELGELVGATRYGLKEVRYFRMTCEGEPRAQNEVDEVRWVRLTEAAALLTYERDADLLSRLA